MKTGIVVPAKKAALVVLSLSVLSSATVMGDLASSMQAGEWRELATNGLTQGLLEDGAHHILQYTDDAQWDPVTRQFLFLGQGHGSNWDSDPSTHSRFISYSDATNTWTTLPVIPTGENNIGHAYDHSALDPVRRLFFHRPYNSQTVYRYHIDNRTWSTHSNMGIPTLTCCGSLEYFKEIDKLVFINGRGGDGANMGQTWTCAMSGTSWTRVANNQLMGEFEGFGEYNPVHKCVLYGGGNTTNMYKMDGTGAIRTMNNAPFPLGIGESVVSVDPVGGKYLVFFSNRQFYEYDVIGDAWRQIQGTTPPIFTALTSYCDGCWCIVGTPVSTYGVNMFLVWNYANSKAFLYKHSKGTAGEPAPQTPAADRLHVSPNPIHGSGVISFSNPDKNVSLAIYDTHGKRVWTRRNTDQGRIILNTEKLAAGVYFLKADAGAYRVIKPLLVQ